MELIEELKLELADVNRKIDRLQPNDSYLDAVHRSFPLGMVGGSGRNVRSLNKRRAASMDRSIERSKVLAPLYEKQGNLTRRINDIESGKDEKREENFITRAIAMAKMWKALKPGDELPIGNSNGNPTIKVKNFKSVITTNGTKWTATEVIGKRAAKYI